MELQIKGGQKSLEYQGSEMQSVAMLTKLLSSYYVAHLQIAS